MDGRAYEDRVKFHPELDVMEVDFSHLLLRDSADVNRFYDVVDRKIAETGRNWYFLVNYEDCRIEQEAWFQHALRGKQVNIAHSLGSVRFNPEDAMRLAIQKASRDENFDPNLVATRKEALARISEMRRARG